MEDEQVKISPSEFAAKIKAKYPQYKDVEDVELVGRITEKYPEYKDQIDLSVGGDSTGKPVSERASTESSEELESSGGGLTGKAGTSELEESTRSDFGLKQEDIDKYVSLSIPASQIEQTRQDLRKEGLTEEQVEQSVPLGFTDEALQKGVERSSFILDTTEEEANERLKEVKSEISKWSNDLYEYNKMVVDANEAGGVTEEQAATLESQASELNERRDSLLDEEKLLTDARTFYRAQRGNRIGALSREFDRGVIDVMKGGARLLALGSQAVAPAGTPDVVFEQAQNKIGELGKLLEVATYAQSFIKDDPISQAQRETTQEYIENKYENGTLLDKAILSVARSAPAMATGAAGLVAQSTSAGYDAIDQAAGDRLSENEKLAYATTYGVVVGALERLGLVGTFASKTKLGNFVNKVISQAAKNGDKLTTGNVNRLVREVAAPMIRAGISEGSTEGAQEAAGAAMEQAVNAIKEDQIFEEFDWNTTLDRIWESTKVGAVAGQSMIAPVAMINAGSITASEFSKNKETLEPEVAQASMDGIDAREDAGDITPEQATEFKQDISQAVEINESIPDNLTDAQAAEAFKLLQEKRGLEAQIDGKDKSLTTPQQERIKEIDERLQNITTQDENVQQENEQREEVQPTDQTTEQAELQADVQEVAPEIKMSFPSNASLRKAKDVAAATNERNRIKEDYKQLRTLMDCLWKK